MRKQESLGSIVLAALLPVAAALVMPDSATAQVRPLYTPGINATNSRVMRSPGLTYVNIPLDYTFNELYGADGQALQANGIHKEIQDVDLFRSSNDERDTSKQNAPGSKRPHSRLDLSPL